MDGWPPDQEPYHVPVQAPASPQGSATDDLRAFAAGRRFGTILADPPWQFTNRTGKMAPEHRRLSRYSTMPLGGRQGSGFARERPGSS
jgi:hypothetical protein